MPDIARPVLKYIYDLFTKDRYPAFLFLARDGRIQTWGGKLDRYGITQLEQGDAVEDRIFLLDGFFPMEQDQMLLPCVQTESGASADIHIFPGKQGYWLLFLDTTEEEARQSVLQQRANDLCLLRDRQAKILEQYIGKEFAENLLQPDFRSREESQHLSVLFADIRGFAAYSRQKCVPDAMKLLNAYLNAIIGPVLDQGGVVDKIIRGSVMAVFGIKPSDISPEIQSVKAGFRIIETVRSFQEAGAKENPEHLEDSEQLELGIGIASGQAILGIMGPSSRRTFSVIGTAADMASYLESRARSNEILIDQNTFQKIGELQKRFANTALKLTGTEKGLKVFSGKLST